MGEEVKGFGFSEKEKAFVKAIDRALGILFNPVNEVQVEEILDLAETYPQHQIEAVAKKAGLNGIRRSAILGWMRKGLENFDRLYADEADPEHKALSYTKRDGLERQLKEWEIDFDDCLEVQPSRFPDGKEAYMDQQLTRINNHRRVLGQPARVMPDYVGRTADATPDYPGR